MIHIIHISKQTLTKMTIFYILEMSFVFQYFKLSAPLLFFSCFYTAQWYHATISMESGVRASSNE